MTCHHDIDTDVPKHLASFEHLVSFDQDSARDLSNVSNLALLWGVIDEELESSPILADIGQVLEIAAM